MAACRFAIPIRGPFSLRAAGTFLCGFTPASESCALAGDALALGLLADGDYAPAGVLLREQGGAVHGEAAGVGDEERLGAQVARILGLDGDGEGFGRLLAADPRLAALSDELGQLRPVAFASPYEAALWGVIAQRIQMRQAAAIKRRLCEELGSRLTVGGREVLVPPPPRALAGLERFAGLTDEKLARLRGIAGAAADGQLDPTTLRALPYDQAVARLSSLRGVGPWTAAHIVVRGAATVDVLPSAEPRVARAVQLVYGLPEEPSLAALERIAEEWRPFRTWVAILVTVKLARSGEWSAPGDGKKRARRPR